MRIAIFGATSEIAKDLILSFAERSSAELVLYARRAQAASTWLELVGMPGRYPCADFADFDAASHFDALINFVGVGNPATAQTMGASIFDVTVQYDELALRYVRSHPHCKYLFLSSGAAYGSGFDTPADANTKATVPINHLQPQDWYGAAKLHAECRHRALHSLPIVDIRVFNYISPTQDPSAAYLTCDILRAIQSRTTLATSSVNIVRDYIGPEDFYALVRLILDAPPTNSVVDCYTTAPVEKITLLAAMQERYALDYRLTDGPAGLSATGVKKNYYSTNRSAQQFGYFPQHSALENVLHSFEASLGTMHHVLHTEPGG